MTLGGGRQPATDASPPPVPSKGQFSIPKELFRMVDFIYTRGLKEVRERCRHALRSSNHRADGFGARERNLHGRPHRRNRFSHPRVTRVSASTSVTRWTRAHRLNWVWTSHPDHRIPLASPPHAGMR